jgi:glycosyltransferase involved in cell wall biosynthesis
MINEYQKANLFICSSSIENSPNSVGEAQLLGTPVIASYVGGVPDMVIHNETGLLYRFEEVEMLSENIRTIFNNRSFLLNLSKNGITIANLRHNRQVNLNKTVDIYSKILNS